MVQLHHVGLCPADLDASVRFYRDGLGLDVLFDVELEVDLEELLGVRTSVVRTVFLGSRDDPEAGTVELLGIAGMDVASEPPASPTPHRGLYLLSFQIPVDPTLTRLAELGLGGSPRRMTARNGVRAATVTDPDGITVELLDQPLSLRPRPD